MSQFPPRFRIEPPSSTSSDNGRLRTTPEDHYGHPYHQGRDSQIQDNRDHAYSDRYQDIQKIKKLSFWSNADQASEGDGEWNERQSPSTFILAIIILVVSGTLLWFLFRWLSGDQLKNPPIIVADTAPFKVRPENPGGMMIPHQDKLIYGRLSPDTAQPVERLLPPPEQLMATPPYPSQPPGQYEGQPQGGYQEGYQEQRPYGPPPVQPPYPQEGYAPHPAIHASPSQAAQPPYPQDQAGRGGAMAPGGSLPPQMMPSSVPQQNYPYGNPQAQQYPYPQAQPSSPPMHQGQPPYPVPYGGGAAMPQNRPDLTPQEAEGSGLRPQKKGSTAIEAIKPASDEDEEGMGSQEGQMELDQLIAQETAMPVRKPIKKAGDNALKPTPLDPSRTKVQIASLPSRAMAEKEMKRLKTTYGQLLGNRPWNIQKVNLGSDRGITYRLVVGSFANRGHATKFCSKLRTEGIGCLVVAPAGE